MLIKIDMKNVNVMFLLNFLEKKNNGETTLQNIIPKYDHQYGPSALLKKANCSYTYPEYQEINNSVKYATPTIIPVARITLFIDSM